MKNNDFSLQLLTHKQIFANREDAATYFEDNFKPYALAGEPAIAFYGEEKSPKAIIAIGTSTDKRIFFIDVEELSEQIKALDEVTEEEKEEIADAVDLIKDIISACGLTFDENKKTNRVTYEPDIKDEVICDAKSLGEAINLISKFVQKGFKDSALKVEDTETIKLVYTDSEDGGKLLKANVKLSESGDSDDVDFNDNIICKKSDGIYATSNLEYDADKHQLVFTSSGYKDGKYKDDAHRKTISLEEHSSIDVENHNHNIALTINKVSGTNKYIISGDVVLSENVHNILEVENNALLVKGISSKIQYANTTVEKELDNINDKIDDVNDKIDNITDNLNIEGTSTDTLNVSVRKLSHGFSVSGDVRLSNDGSIKVSDGGICTNIDVNVDTLTNTLTLSNGSRTKTVTLPGIEIVKNIYYDEANAVLVIELTNSSNPLKIPVADMIETIDVQNDASSAVELHKHSKEGVTGKSYLSGTLKIRTNDNLLAKDSSTGELYVPKSSMTDAIAEETNRAKEAEKVLQSNIDANTKAINDEVTRAKAAETELHNSDDAINTELLSVKNKLEAETTARETFDNAIKATVDSHTQSLTDINSSLNEVKSDLAEETSARELADANLTNSINANTTAIEKEVNRAKEVEATISETVEKNAEAFETFKETTNTSIQSLKDADTELKELITDKVTDINAEIATVKNNVTTVTNGLTSEVERAKEAEAILTSSVTENKKAIADEVKRSSEKDVEIENTLSTHIDKFDDFKAATDKSIEKLTEASESVTAKVNEIDNAYKTADTTLQTNLDKEVIRATTAEEKLSTNLEAEVTRAKAEETTLSNKIADNTVAINAEVTRATAAETELTEKVNTKVAAVEIRKNSASDLQYTLYVDEKPCGDINIPEDQFLKSVTYDEVSKIIHFVFKTTDGEQTSDINVSDLVDTYTAGNGLKLDGNKFSVQISEGSESYLTVTEGGVKLVGINTELAKKANVGDSYTKDESDAKYLTEHQDISNLATKSEVKAVSDELAETETKVTENANTIAIINGNEATEGSIKKSLADAKSYTDSKVSDSERSTLETAKTYTDVSVNAEIERAKAAEKANADTIVALQSEDTAIKSELTKKVEKVTIEKNSASDLQYILYVDDKKVSEINIAKDQFLKDVSYDSTSKKLHFVFETTDGVKEQDIEIGDLVDTYTAGDGLKVEDNKFSVVINNDSEKYLTLSNEGLKISGIDTALADKAKVGDSYTKEESDAKYLTEHQSLDTLATKEALAVTDTKVATLDTRVKANEDSLAIVNGNEATDGSIKKALADSKAYTDKAVKVETDRATAKEVELATEIATKVGDVKLEKDAHNDLVYALYVDGTKSGEITIPKDQFLKDVSYNAKSKELVFVFTTSDGEKTTTVDVADLVDTYKAGDGLSISDDNTFVVKVGDSSEKYLTVTAEGIVISGIDTALATKAEVGSSYTKSESDAKYLTEHQDISALATKDEVKVVSDKLTVTDVNVADSAKAIEILNGNEATVGSVKKALADAKAYTDTKITENTYTAGEGMSLNDKKFAVKKADGSQKYLEVIADGVKIVGIDEALATKANSADVYTIAQIDAKGYLTEHQDISGLAKKTEVETVDEKLSLAKTDLETKIGNVATNVTNEVTRATDAEKALETKIADNFTKSSFSVNKTNTVNLVKTANTDGSSVLTANVEVSSISGNLIKADQPLYASVDLSYDEGTNTLKFSSSALAETKEIKLSVGSIIDSITYDAATEEIVISYTNASGEKGEVRFSARTLFNQLTVQTDHLGAIILSKETKDGKDILSGEVVLSSLATNALINDQGSLYVSNQAKDYKMADDTTVENAITTVKTTVNTLSEKVTEFGAKVTAIEANDKVQDTNIKANSDSIVSIKEKNIEQDGKITTLEANDKVQDTNIKSNSDAITTINGKVADIEDKVDEIDKRTTTIVSNTASVEMNKTTDGVISSKVILNGSANNLIQLTDEGLFVDGSVADYGTY